jgi:hypothetical protein
VDNPYATPPDPEELKQVVKAMVAAWKTGADYIADSKAGTSDTWSR